jgi:hypothetical protein
MLTVFALEGNLDCRELLAFAYAASFELYARAGSEAIRREVLSAKGRPALWPFSGMLWRDEVSMLIFIAQ